MRAAIPAVAISMALGLGACGGGGGGGSDTGRLSLGVTDAPVDEASSVVVQFSGVAFKRAGAAPELVQNLTPSPRQLDLLQYQGGRAALLLDGVTLPAGDYQWIRLIVDNEPDVRDSYIVLTGGEECELRVPSGAESGLKLNRGFTLPADGSVALTIDFDLRKSIHAPPGQQGSGRSLHARLPDAPDAANRRRRERRRDRRPVDSALVTEECLPKVYVFSGSGVTPDDIEEANRRRRGSARGRRRRGRERQHGVSLSRRVPAAGSVHGRVHLRRRRRCGGRHAHLHGHAERDGADEYHQHGGLRRAGVLSVESGPC